MVTRINGAPAQGVFFSKDVRFVSVTIDTGTTAFLTDLTVTSTSPRQADAPNSDLEQIVEIMSQRGSVIGMTVASDSVVNFMVDYGQAIDPLAGTAIGNQTAQGVGAALELEIETNLATVTAATIAVQQGFAPAGLGAPA